MRMLSLGKKWCVGPRDLEDCFVGVWGVLGNFGYSRKLYAYVQQNRLRYWITAQLSIMYHVRPTSSKTSSVLPGTGTVSPAGTIHKRSLLIQGWMGATKRSWNTSASSFCPAPRRPSKDEHETRLDKLIDSFDRQHNILDGDDRPLERMTRWSYRCWLTASLAS
jgi:hypothetical protein